jgi:hypothetical protein
MNSLHFLIKYNSFKKEQNLDELTTGGTDADDDELKMQSLTDVNQMLSIDAKIQTSTERTDLLKIKVRIMIFVYIYFLI